MKPEYKNTPDYPEHGIRDVRDIEVYITTESEDIALSKELLKSNNNGRG